MKKINSRSGILPGAIIMVALFFIFDKLNANRDFYIITLGLVTVIVDFFTSLICDYNRKINKFQKTSYNYHNIFSCSNYRFNNKSKK